MLNVACVGAAQCCVYRPCLRAGFCTVAYDSKEGGRLLRRPLAFAPWLLECEFASGSAMDRCPRLAVTTAGDGRTT